MADVIICLGDTFHTPKNIEYMKLRTEKAVELYKSGKAKKIIFTGGFKTRKDISEAKFMSDLAIKLGVPKKNTILEEKANTTIENAYYSEKIMDKNKFKSAIVVTSPHHIKRAKYIFNKIMKNKSLEFVNSKNNAGFFEAIKNYADETQALQKLKTRGIINTPRK